MKPQFFYGQGQRAFRRAGGGALARGRSWGCGGDFCGAKELLLAPDWRIAKIVTARGGMGEGSAINLTRNGAFLRASCNCLYPSPFTLYPSSFGHSDLVIKKRAHRSAPLRDGFPLSREWR